MRALRAGSLAALLSACAVEEAGVPPPQDELFFPTGLALHPTAPVLYVTNGNADLRYNKGTLLALNLDKAGPCLDLNRPCDPEECFEDPIGPGLRNCDEPRLLLGDAELGRKTIGSFAGEIEIRDGIPSGCPGWTARPARLYLLTRSDPSAVTWVDLGGDGTFLRSKEVELAGEPFGTTLLQGCGGTRVMVTHLSNGSVTLLADREDCNAGTMVASVQRDADGVAALAASASLFPVDRSGRRRAAAIAPRRPDECEGLVYVTSSTSFKVATVRMDGLSGPLGVRLIEGPGFEVAPPLDDEAVLGERHGTDTRGIAFSPEGDRAWLATREPPALMAVDTSLEHELPRNEPQAFVEVCPEPSLVRARPGPEGRPLVYVVCFVTSEIYVVDGDLMEVVDVIRTGRGPAGLEFDATLPRAFVAHFAENTIGVIDLDPTSLRYHRLIATLGLPEPLL